MQIEYKIKGIVLSEWEMHDIKKRYEICTIAETIMYVYHIEESYAVRLAEKVRELMVDHGVSEANAIQEIIRKEVSI